MKDQPRVNNGIRAKEVRVIDEHGGQLGVMSLSEALGLADTRGTDLIEIAPAATPPVCRLMDYGKYKYQIARKLSESRKKQTVIQLKEIKFRPKTEKHDFEFKVRHIQRFLEGGDKAKVVVTFRGREIAHPQLGHDMINQVLEATKDFGEAESNPSFDGRALVVIINPIPEVVKRYRARKEAEAREREKKNAENED